MDKTLNRRRYSAAVHIVLRVTLGPRLGPLLDALRKTVKTIWRQRSIASNLDLPAVKLYRSGLHSNWKEWSESSLGCLLGSE